MSYCEREWFNAFEIENLAELDNHNASDSLNHLCTSTEEASANTYNSKNNFSPHFGTSDHHNSEIIMQMEEIIQSNKLLIADQIKLKERMEKNKKIVSNYLEYIHCLEKKVSQLDQYGRRENIELAGIPSKIPNNDLEYVVINILKHIGLTNIQPYDISAYIKKYR